MRQVPITVIGNLTRDPELRFTPQGAAVANFDVASTPSRWDKQSGGWVDGDTTFYGCTVWKDHAENVAESLTKGTQVVVVGQLKNRTYETKSGEQRTSLEIDVDVVGPTLVFATAKVTKAGGNTNRGRAPAQQAPAADPWGNQTEESPF